MNQKGITMATVVVMIIIMIIIATVSIVAGNRVIVNSKDYQDEQEIASVKAAVLRKKTEVNMAGTLVPLGEAYVGIINPIVKADDTGSVVANGWYLLDEENLERLGIHDASTRFLVHYDYEVVIPMKSEDYLEEYMIVEFLHDLIDSETTAGIPLQDKSGDGMGSDTTSPMVKNKEKNEYFGTGWYLIKKEHLPANYAKHIDHSYLLQIDRAQYVQVTSDFEGVDIESISFE